MNHKLSKDQQKFWDILRLPYGVKGECDYCVHMKRYSRSSTNLHCREPEYEKTGMVNCSTEMNNPKWKWNGKV